MTYGEAIQELAVAISYALDATKDHRDWEYKKEARRLSEEILDRVVNARPYDYDNIVISGKDIK